MPAAGCCSVAPMIKPCAVIPVYNHQAAVTAVVSGVLAQQLACIIVDDGSTPACAAVLDRLAAATPSRVTWLRHPTNRGKGAAVRSGLVRAIGEIVIVQDADLEYDPQDYYELVKPIAEGRVNVVFGSRFLGRHTGMYFWNALGNKGLTFLTNLLFNCWISDMETGYKMFRRDSLRDIQIEEERFGFEPEIVAKIAKVKGIRIYEVPVSYLGRTYEEGKKMKPSQGLYAILALLQYRFLD